MKRPSGSLHDILEADEVSCMWPQQHHGKSLSSLNYDDGSLTCTESEYLPSSRNRLRVRLKILGTNRNKLLT